LAQFSATASSFMGMFVSHPTPRSTLFSIA